MHGSLVNRAVAHEAQAAAFEALVFHGIGDASSEWRLAADDAVPAPVILVRREEVHRASFSARAAGGFALKLGHAFVHRHADCQGVPVIAISGDDVVVVAEEVASAYGNGLLADVEVKKSANLALLVNAQGAFFKASDAHHVGVEAQLVLGAERLIDGGFRVWARNSRLGGAHGCLVVKGLLDVSNVHVMKGAVAFFNNYLQALLWVTVGAQCDKVLAKAVVVGP